MKEISDAKACGFANELISFVYGELSNSESQEFKLHLNTCQECSAELDSFGEMREAIGVWKYESLSAVFSLNEVPAVPPERKKYAIAALREFFDLSPLWMKGAVGLATVLFCVLAVVATGRLNIREPVAPPTPSAKVYNQQEVDALIAKALAERSNTTEVQAAGTQPVSPVPVQTHGEKRRTVALTMARNKRPLSRAEREQLAADLRLGGSRNDDAVDLISDRINE